MELVKESFNEDLREDSWKCLGSKDNDDFLDQEYLDKTTNIKYFVKTKFGGEDSWGDPIIRWQQVYKMGA